MKRHVFLGLLAGCLMAASPMQIVRVGRAGLPPYEGSDRFYRLEGEGCAELTLGETLSLSREGERRALPHLQVFEVHPEYALARISQTGETYLLKGDLVVRVPKPGPMPELPPPHQEAPAPRLEVLQVGILGSLPVLPVAKPDAGPRAVELRPGANLSIPFPEEPGTMQRGPLFFLKGDASLSPGAFDKLKTWAETWGLKGKWSLIVPRETGSIPWLLRERIAVTRSELLRLGVEQLEIRYIPPDPPGTYDAIYLERKP